MPAAPNPSPHHRRPRSPQKNFPQHPPPHPLSRSMKTTKGLARCTLRPEIHHHSAITQNMGNNKERRTTLQLQEEHGNAPTTSRGHGTNAQTAAEGPVSAHQQAAKSRKQKHENKQRRVGNRSTLQLQDNRPQVHPHGTGQAQLTKWTVTARTTTTIAKVCH